jgi:hypothetical protein
MASNKSDPSRSHRYRDFHADRVRDRTRWRAFLLSVFVLAGAAAVYALMTIFNR